MRVAALLTWRSPLHARSASRPSWLPPLAGAVAVARITVIALRPREGLIEPDPVDEWDYFSPDDIARARNYGRPQLALQAAVPLVQGVLLALRLRSSPRLDDPRRPHLRALLDGAGLSLVGVLAVLPLRILARRRALRAGLATGSWKGWTADLAKSTAIATTMTAGGAVAAVWVIRRYPRGWWAAGALASVLGGVLFSFLAPVLLDPIFNRFTVLPDGSLRAEVLELARRAGVGVGEVYKVDASTRTSAANAYVTGLGATKRVVLFDTLLDSFSREETRIVLAHELAHVRHRDVLRSLAQMALVAPSSMYATARLAGRLQDESAPTLPGLALALAIVGAVVSVAGSPLSRSVEARADAFALALTDAPESFIAFEQRIVRQNLADPAPPRWLSVLLASHPAAVQRIGIALAYKRGVR